MDRNKGAKAHEESRQKKIKPIQCMQAFKRPVISRVE
jgi:hypothetical protein